MEINKNVKMEGVFIEKRRKKGVRVGRKEGVKEGRKREEFRNNSVASCFVRTVERSLVVK